MSINLIYDINDSKKLESGKNYYKKYLKYKRKYLSLKNKIDNNGGDPNITQKKHVILGGYEPDYQNFINRWENWKPDDLIIIVDKWPYMIEQREGNFVFIDGDFNDSITFENEIFDNIDTIRFDVSTFKFCLWDCKMLDKVISILKVGGVLYIPQPETRYKIISEKDNNTEIIDHYKKHWDKEIEENPYKLMNIIHYPTYWNNDILKNINDSYEIRHNTFTHFFQDPVYKDYNNLEEDLDEQNIRKTSDNSDIILKVNTFRDFLVWLLCLKNCVLVKKISTYDLPDNNFDWNLIGNISIEKVNENLCINNIPLDITDNQEETGMYTGGSI